MVNVRETSVGFGTVRLIGKVDPVLETVEKHGNVTVRNAGSAGQPAYFEVAHQIQFYTEQSGISLFNVFSLTIPLTDILPDTPYTQIELEAARQLALVLRSCAQQIEALVMASEAKGDEAASAPS